MNQTTFLKRTFAVACVLFISGMVAPATAQDVSKENRDEATTSETRDEASRRIDEQSKRLDRETETDEEERRPGYDRDQFEDDQEGMTPEQIDKLKRRIEGKNRTMIKKLDRIIENDPYNDKKPAWLFQKAELLWQLRNMEYLRERAKYNQCVDAAAQGTAADCEEPEAEYSEPQAIYKEILTEYPDYDRLDEVIFRLGSGLIEAGKGPQAVSFLQRLVKNYPNSKYLADAHLALAEFFFEKEMLGAARDNYLAVLEKEDDPNFDFALYKLGWVYYNQGEFRDSINTFKRVVERTDEKLGFQNQAINDLVIAYAEVDDGWKEVREYFTEKRDQEFTFKKLGQMASLYEGQGKDGQAIAVYEYFIEERPNHKRIPAWMESIIVAKKKINDFDDLEETMNTYVAYLDPDGTWAKTNSDNEGSLNNAALLSQASLAFLANKYHRQAQKHEEEPAYKKAIGYYREFIRRFPDAPASFDMNFFVADIYLLELNNYEEAAVFYQRVVDLYKEDKTPKNAEQEDIEAIVQDSAYGVVNAYNELVKTNHDDSVLVEMANYQEQHGDRDFKRDSVDTSTENEPNPKVDIPTYEKGFVEASDQYSEMYPADNITPTVDYVSAEVYKARGHYDKCIPRYESIIENAPKHRYASYAGGSLLVANYVLKNWNDVEKWARYMMENEIFHVTPKEDLTQAIALAINERAKELKEESNFEKATAELLRLAEEFPDSELAPGALFNAAAIYESGEQNNKALEVYQRVVNDYPQSLQAPEALFVMGAIYKTRADFETAADYFAQMGSTDEYVNAEGDDVEYKDHPQAAQAVYNAGYLLDNMEQWDKAIDAYEKYIRLYSDMEEEQEQIKKVKLVLPYLEMEEQRWAKALKRFRDYKKLDDLDPEEYVMLNSEMGLLVEKIEGRNWQDDSNEYFNKSLELWKALEDEKKQYKTVAFATQARFRQAERVYETFKRVKFSFPMSKLTKSLQEKGELEQEAEKIYREIIDMAREFGSEGSKVWLTASAYRIGQMYRDFASQLNNLPLPDGLTPEQEDQYRFALEDQIFPLEEKALEAFRFAQSLAIQYQAYNEWSSKSAKQISSMEGESYPITEQQGVDTSHGRINFFIPAPNTDLEAISAQAAKRKPVAPKPQPGEGQQAPGDSPDKDTKEGAADGPQAGN